MGKNLDSSRMTDANLDDNIPIAETTFSRRRMSHEQKRV